jgi:hypothetical protein
MQSRRADFGSGTALYDAVDFRAAQTSEQIEGRKAIVLFTDGVDTFSSKADYDSTLADSERADALIFPIYYNTYLNNLGIGNGGVMSSPYPFPGGGSLGIGTSSAIMLWEENIWKIWRRIRAAKFFDPKPRPAV